MLTHIAKVELKPEEATAIERLARKHLEQDKRELHGDEKVTLEQKNSSMVGEDSLDGALWDIFRREDAPKLQEYLKKHFREFRHVHCDPLKQVRLVKRILHYLAKIS